MTDEVDEADARARLGWANGHVVDVQCGSSLQTFTLSCVLRPAFVPVNLGLLLPLPVVELPEPLVESVLVEPVL